MLQADVYADFYLKPLLIALALEVLPDTPEIALLSCSSLFQPGRKIDHGSRDAACLARAGHHLVSRTNGSAQLSPRAPGCNEVHAGSPAAPHQHQSPPRSGTQLPLWPQAMELFDRLQRDRVPAQGTPELRAAERDRQLQRRCGILGHQSRQGLTPDSRPLALHRLGHRPGAFCCGCASSGRQEAPAFL